MASCVDLNVDSVDQQLQFMWICTYKCNIDPGFLPTDTGLDQSETEKLALMLFTQITPVQCMEATLNFSSHSVSRGQQQQRYLGTC